MAISFCLRPDYPEGADTLYLNGTSPAGLDPKWAATLREAMSFAHLSDGWEAAIKDSRDANFRLVALLHPVTDAPTDLVSISPDTLRLADTIWPGRHATVVTTKTGHIAVSSPRIAKGDH